MKCTVHHTTLYYSYLGTDSGGGKKGSPVKEMATDLSKFLFFSCKGQDLDMKRVASFKAVEAFVEELRRRKVGPSGIIGKLNVLMLAQSFLLYR